MDDLRGPRRRWAPVGVDLVDDAYAARYLPEVAVEGLQLRAALADDDEELAPVGARAAGVGHGKGASRVDRSALRGTPVEGVTRAAAPGPGWVPALVHEACHHAVEGGAVIEVIARQEHEVVDGGWVFCRQELDRDRPDVGEHRRGVLLGGVYAHRWGSGKVRVMRGRAVQLGAPGT